MYIYIAAALAALLYYAYKRFRGPTYVPGAVSRQAIRSPSEFDSADWVAKTTADLWHMPDDIVIYRTLAPSTHAAPLDVICIHGGPAIAPAAPWRICQEPLLLSRASFHTYHQRGCGQSSRPFSSYPSLSFYPGCVTLEKSLGLGAQIGDIERARRRIGAEKIMLIGHSFGGLVATLYASEFPDHVSALALLTPASLLHSQQSGSFDFFSAIRERLPSEQMRKEFDGYIKKMLDFSVLPRLNEKQAADIHEEFAMHWQRANPEMYMEPPGPKGSTGGWAAYASYLSLGIEFDYRRALRKRLSNAKFKTIVLNGKQDMIPVEEGLKYVELFPKEMAKHICIDGGHFLADEKSKELAQVLDEELISKI